MQARIFSSSLLLLNISNPLLNSGHLLLLGAFKNVGEKYGKGCQPFMKVLLKGIYYQKGWQPCAIIRNAPCGSAILEN
jgi:hypothetical protein